MTRRILSDELGDPASWAGVPENFAPFNAFYLDTRLVDVKLTNGDLVITLRFGEDTFSATLSDSYFKTLTAAQILDILLPYRGDLLLNALTHEIGAGWQYVELSEEEKTVLISISKDQLSRLYESKIISDQRIQLAKDRLTNIQFIDEGPGGFYALQSGREWLNAKGLLK